MKKKSGKKVAQTFHLDLVEIETFMDEIDQAGLGAHTTSWAYDAALLKMYVALERAMLDCLVVAVNNDSSTISASSGVSFPKHMSDEVCEYLVTGGDYFDFKGRDGLIKVLKDFVPGTHWLVITVKDAAHTSALNQLVALRNYAAHESPSSKRKALALIGQKRMGTAGSWSKKQGRARRLTADLKNLAIAIEAAAPY